MRSDSCWRHLLAILLLPGMVVLVVPTWILTSLTGWDLRCTGAPLVRSVVGTLLVLAGSGLFTWCVVLFARVGQGTLAPWDPTRRLVAAGPYRYVRNPMISGVAALLLGLTLLSGSALLAGWLAAFVAVTHVYFLASEEPGLERRFGASYRDYKETVPRWLPRKPGNRLENPGVEGPDPH
jgi:protein-S-isoprenylcysteine O-methyltransferase Ste14